MSTDVTKKPFPVSILICILIGIVLVIMSMVLIHGAFFWFEVNFNLYELGESLILAMLGCVSLLIGVIFIIVGSIIYKLDHKRS